MTTEFQSVINTRYKSPLLSKIWAPDNRVKIIRQLWIDLAIEQQKLGIKSISIQAIDELIKYRDIIDYNKINEYEMLFKHDIIAHIHAYSDLCPTGGKILHLGATSNFINDNSDSILIKDCFHILFQKMTTFVSLLKHKSLEYANIPTIAYTHLQPAQLITIGRRFAMWVQDVSIDLNKLQNTTIPFRGIKGTVGSEDTLLKLFNGNHELCDKLNQELANKYHFNTHITICGQTYSRKYDVEIIHSLSLICQTIYKIMNDIRLLSGKMEVYEKFEKHQVGSSAMPYKKNPINCEKICSLCRYIINQEQSITQTYINQWLERTLDDSAIKRIIYPECFMLLEYILDQSIIIINDLCFNFKYINSLVQTHMINIISEEIILKGVEMGYSRIDIHEKLRKILTNDNTSYDSLLSDTVIKHIINTYNITNDPLNYIGRSIEQCLII